MQCLYYALDEWHQNGGYLILGKSVHWGIPHVMHSMTAPDDVTHFVPPSDLKQPWHSLFGFKGSVVTGDKDYRGRMRISRIVVGSLILGVFGVAWAVRRKYLDWRDR